MGVKEGTERRQESRKLRGLEQIKQAVTMFSVNYYLIYRRTYADNFSSVFPSMKRTWATFPFKLTVIGIIITPSGYRGVLAFALVLQLFSSFQGWIVFNHMSKLVTS